jgi:hypothetical protein
MVPLHLQFNRIVILIFEYYFTDRLATPFRINLAGMIQALFQLLNVRLQFLLHPQSLGPSLRLALERDLERLDHPLQRLPNILELVLLLLDSPIDFLTSLSNLELVAKRSVLLLIKNT